MSHSHLPTILIGAKIARRSRTCAIPFSSFAPFPPCAVVIYLAMALSQNGSLPERPANTHAHYQVLPRRPHTLKEATYIAGLPVGEVVEWAKGWDPSPNLIHIDMREPERAGALCNKRWAIELWQQLLLALLELRAVCLIPAPKKIDSLLGVISSHGAGKLKSGFAPSI